MSELTTCRSVLGIISSYLDGDLDPSACDVVERHCGECPQCATLVSGLRDTIGLCRELGSTPLPDPVRRLARDRVRQLLDGDRSPK